jgi:hypothetical protein
MRNTAGASGNSFYQHQNKRVIKKESVVKNYGEIDERIRHPNGNAFNIFAQNNQAMMETKGSLQTSSAKNSFRGNNNNYNQNNLKNARITQPA